MFSLDDQTPWSFNLKLNRIVSKISLAKEFRLGRLEVKITLLL